VGPPAHDRGAVSRLGTRSARRVCSGGSSEEPVRGVDVVAGGVQRAGSGSLAASVGIHRPEDDRPY
jgi:hypothetical protein